MVHLCVRSVVQCTHKIAYNLTPPEYRISDHNVSTCVYMWVYTEKQFL